jgi:multidrug efflux pump subunit AcrA (membrane-fusion protein)
MRATQRRRKARTRRRALVTACVTIVVAATGIVVSRGSASGAPSYRTAAVTTPSLSRTLAVSGTLEPIRQATADFQTAGSVASVNVKRGQKVTAGEVTATLNTSTLKGAPVALGVNRLRQSQ